MPSTSLSFKRKSTVIESSSLNVNVSSTASGPSFIGLIFKRTHALSHNTGKPLSHKRYINESTPWKFGFGLNVIVPLALTTTVPLFGIVRITGLFNVPSTSLSFIRKSTVIESSSLNVNVSSTASGPSFIGLIFKRTHALSHKTGKPLSHTRYINESTPWKFGFGLNVIVPFGLITTVPLLG